MTALAWLELATWAALGLEGLAMALTLVRLVIGPTLPDRILALDLLTTLTIGCIVIFAIRTGMTLYLDLAIGLALIGFLATVALARYLLRHGTKSRGLEQREEKSHNV
ncbi:MAG: transporter protein [Devosia sp.]|nr:transporter protein [Devosia sp.]